jgi:hypothetical protein
MRCLMASLILLSTISVAQADKIKFCFLFCAVETPAAVDSYTTLYERVILSPQDADSVKQLPRALRERLTRNEVLYRCSTGWNNPICAEAKK